MAAQIPIKVMKDGSDNTCGLAQFSSSDNLPVSVGGTGLTTQGICAFAQPGINAVACKSTYIGICAGKSEAAADENTYVGYAAGQNVTTGCYHTIIGSNAGDAITTADDNTLVGYAAGGAITTGLRNTLVGSKAGDGFDAESDNVFIGYSTGGFGGLLTHRLNIINDTFHELGNQLNLLKYLFIEFLVKLFLYLKS